MLCTLPSSTHVSGDGGRGEGRGRELKDRSLRVVDCNEEREGMQAKLKEDEKCVWSDCRDGFQPGNCCLVNWRV